LETEKYEKYISKDRKIIKLPIPLDSQFYEIYTKCSDVCLFQKELADKAKEDNPEIVDCNKYAACHTQIDGIYKMGISLYNLTRVLDIWGEFAFATEEEANIAANRLMKEHREKLINYGFKLDENGYAINLIKKD